MRVSWQTCSPKPAESLVGSTFITPAGTPAWVAKAAIAKADKGVSAAGLTMTAHPAASAGASFRASMALGKFHGVMATTTPTDFLITRERSFSDLLGKI